MASRSPRASRPTRTMPGAPATGSRRARHVDLTPDQQPCARPPSHRSVMGLPPHLDRTPDEPAPPRWPDPSSGTTRLARKAHALRRVHVGELRPADLRTPASQQVALPYVVPGLPEPAYDDLPRGAAGEIGHFVAGVSGTREPPGSRRRCAR
ncbi:contact-dependent growth inhibition system immunity protein [Streptomyces sp. NPDC019224]|uniref:contact-dependent growth inhibition system immunity protein n=1 Tax=Streptomyces sp. NPDC019224 TaxID=3154484 RepID=UPI003407A8E3